jgi:hypothetical protein
MLDRGRIRYWNGRHDLTAFAGLRTHVRLTPRVQVSFLRIDVRFRTQFRGIPVAGVLNPSAMNAVEILSEAKDNLSALRLVTW